MTNRSNTTAKANLVTRGFWWPTSMFPRNYRPCVSPSEAEGMNQGADARLPDGSGTNSG